MINNIQIKMPSFLLTLILWTVISTPAIAFTLTSSDFQNGGPIPRMYTCQGGNVSPPLAWTETPLGTKSYVLLMVDPDTQQTLGFPYIHWVVFDINGQLSSLTANTSQGKRGINAAQKVSYYAPCPPPGMGAHHYIFQLYALDIQFLPGLQQGASWVDIHKAMENHILDTAQLTGTYAYVQ